MRLRYLYPRFDALGGMRYTLTSGFTHSTDSYSPSVAILILIQSVFVAESENVNGSGDVMNSIKAQR